MNAEQAKELGRRLHARRKELGLSQRQVQAMTNIDNATIVRLEHGVFTAPAADKLARIADALGMSLADVFALANYAVPDDLPSFQPYLRSKYRDMPADAVEDLNHAFDRIMRKHGYDPDGPKDGEDEAP
jgi:transcriptional regulator with XRE-family HTH domain